MSEGNETRDSHRKRSTRPIDRLTGELAGRQHGVVALGQLIALGVRRDTVEYRIRTGRLHRIHRGVYAVGHRDISRHGRYMAATLIARDAVLSHRSAAELWGIADPRGGAIHVTASQRIRRRRALLVHHARLPDDERAVRDGIPITTVARTLLDIAATEGRPSLERALRQAHFARLTDPLGLPALIERHPGARGTAIAAAALADGTFGKRTRSELEDEFLDFLRARGLPLPETNALVEAGARRYEVDCLWRRAQLVVELDGHDAHAVPARREADLRRDGDLQAYGIAVHRVTPHRLRRDPAGLDAQLRRALSGA